MRRAIVVLGGTVAGLTALFSYKTHVAGVAVASTPTSPAGLSMSAPPMTPSGSPSASATSKAATKKAAPKTSSSASPTMTAITKTPSTTPTTKAPRTTPTTSAPAPTKSSAPAAPSGTFTGPTVNTQYGPMQVQITVSNGKITAANELQQPADSIGANAIPQLNQETLTAQSANIQAVSGATYTSQGYISSLQSAVNKAGL